MPSAPWPTKGTSSFHPPFLFRYRHANRAWRFPSAKYASPPVSHPRTDSHPRSALYGEKLSMHVRSVLPFSPRRQVNVRLFRHHAQQATSEKKRISTVNRRPRAYTSSIQQGSVFFLASPLSFPRCHAGIGGAACGNLICVLLSHPLLTCYLPHHLFSPPSPDKSFVFLTTIFASI